MRYYKLEQMLNYLTIRVKSITYRILILMSFSCGGGEDRLYSQEQVEEDIPLILKMNYPMEDGYYKIDYPNNRPHSYISVEYQTEGMRRIYWTSTDSFTIVHMGYPITEPIINYSTYSRDDGSGKQMIYLYEPFIGDTLQVIGCVDNDNCKSVSFIVE